MLSKAAAAATVGMSMCTAAALGSWNALQLHTTATAVSCHAACAQSGYMSTGVDQYSAFAQEVAFAQEAGN